jgi:hypothetical protein
MTPARKLAFDVLENWNDEWRGTRIMTRSDVMGRLVMLAEERMERHDEWGPAQDALIAEAFDFLNGCYDPDPVSKTTKKRRKAVQ